MVMPIMPPAAVPAAAGAAATGTPGGMDPMMMMQILGSLQAPEQGPMPPATYPSPPMQMNPAFTQMALQALMAGSAGAQPSVMPSLGSLIAGRQ